MAETKAAAQKKRLDLRWTQGKRKKFIAHLAATYDVEAACAFAGLEWPDVCALRTLHPEFAAAFEEVIAAGYDRVEAMLLRKAGAALANGEGDLVLAANLLRQRRALKVERAKAAPARPGGSARKDELIATIISKLAPIKAAQLKGGSWDDRTSAP